MQRMMGLDYGDVRIGVAFSDPLGILAHPHGMVLNNAHAIKTLCHLIGQHDVGLVVVGMPFTLKGEKGPKALTVDAFTETLRKNLSIDVVVWDERFTSKIAHRTLIEMGVKKKKRQSRKGEIDAMAAAIMLQSFLDQTKHSSAC